MAEHTNGKVRTDESEHDAPYQDICIVGKDGRKICTVWIDDAPVPDYNSMQEANARRLVACWNACDGIGTEVLESGQSAPVGWSRTASKLIAVTNQRDELRAALRDFLDDDDTPDQACRCHVSPPCNDCVEHSHRRELVANAKAAIARVELDGGA